MIMKGKRWRSWRRVEAGAAGSQAHRGKPRRNKLVFSRYLDGGGHSWWLGRKGCTVMVGDPQKMEQVPRVHHYYQSCMCPP